MMELKLQIPPKFEILVCSIQARKFLYWWSTKRFSYLEATYKSQGYHS